MSMPVPKNRLDITQIARLRQESFLHGRNQPFRGISFLKVDQAVFEHACHCPKVAFVDRENIFFFRVVFNNNKIF